jgi:hypothetical protein
MTLDSDYSFSLGGKLKGKGLVKGSVELTNAALEMPGLFERGIRFGRGSAELDFTWEPDEYLVALDNLRLTVSAPLSDEEFITTGFVKLGSFGPSVNLDLATTPFELRTLFGLMPHKILPDNITGVLSNVESPGGRLAVRGLTFSGTPGAMEWSDYLKALSVWIELERVTFKHPALVNTPYGITGSMRLIDGNLSLENIKGNYGSLVTEGLDARISDLTVRPSYALDLEVSGKAAQMAGELRRYEFLSVPADLEVKGEASAMLHAEGIWDMRGSLIYSGDVDIDGVDVFKGGLPLPLANLSGEAAFDMEKVNIAWLRGRAGDSEFSLSGKVIDYRSAQPFIDFKTNVELLSGTLPLLVKGLEKTAPDFTDPVYIKGRIQGEPLSIRINSFIDITHTDMTFGRLIKKKKGYPLTLKSTIKLDEKNVVIEDGVLSMRSSTVGFAGNIFRDKPGYEIVYNSEKVLISDLAGVSPYIIEETGLKGTLEFAIKGKREPEFRVPRYEGKMTFKDWRVDTPLFKNPVTGTELTSRFSGNSASIIIGDVNTGESSFSGKVEIKDISRGIVEFDLLSENINAADLLPSTRETALEPFITGRGKITVSKGTAWGFAFQNFTTEIEITRDKMSFPANFTTHEGQVSGEVVYFRDPKDPLFFSTSLKLQKISLESLIEKLGAKKPILSGRVDAVAELEGKRGDTLAEGLNGKVQLVARDGRLWEFVVLRKIFSIVNIIAIQELFEKEGLPYRVITGSFNITDGVIRTEDMALDSKTLRMSAVGKIDMPKSAIKATLALHPFVTLDKIISKIPLAGWIFIGEEGTVNMYYRIKGPLKNPEVNPQPIKTIEKGILGILKRIIETPIKALEPIKSEPAEEEEKKPNEE